MYKFDSARADGFSLVAQRRDILESLSRPEFLKKHTSLLETHVEGTGTWIFDDINFKTWMNESQSILWCQGKGKLPI